MAGTGQISYCFFYMDIFLVLQQISIPLPPPTESTEIQSQGGGGSKRRQFPRGWGEASWGLFWGAASKIGELLKN